MSTTTVQTSKRRNKDLSPKTGGRGNLHKDEPRDKVGRIRSSLFEEMSTSVLGRKVNVDFDDIYSEVWDFWKGHHLEEEEEEK
jgi:hypothetical protein